MRKGRLNKTTAVRLARAYHEYVEFGELRRLRPNNIEILKSLLEKSRAFEAAQNETGIEMISEYVVAYEIEGIEKHLAKLEGNS